MKVEKFDFRRLRNVYDPALVGKRVIFGNTLDDLFYKVEYGNYKGEVLTKVRDDADAPFWSEENGEYFWYVYVLDEGFVDEPDPPLLKVEWLRGDVVNSLARRIDREITDDDVDAVIDDIDWKGLECSMIEHGWVFIDTASDEYAGGLGY